MPCWRASKRRRPRPISGRRSPTATSSNSPMRWRCRIRRRRRRSTRLSRRTTSNSPNPPAAGPRTGSRPMSRRRSKPRRPPPILSRSTVSAVEFRLQFAGQYRAQQQCADAGGSGQGNAAPDAEVLARRQSAGSGRAHRQGRDRAGFARPLAPTGLAGRPSFSHPYWA